MTELKRVSFNIAKAIKDAGYPQAETEYRYTNHGNIFVPQNYSEEIKYCECDAPTYLDVWLWLWRDKRWFIKVLPIKDKFHYQILDHHYDEWHSWGICSETGYQDPEEAIVVAIDYLVDNKLLK